MLKDKKGAFSYVELLFGMVIISVIFSASIPMITQKTQRQAALPGAFMCFSAYDNDLGTFRLYQIMRRGDGNFSDIEDVTENGCQFYKQKNVRSYNVSVIGGGGASNKATENAVSLGQNGQRLNIIGTTLAGVWDENNILNIRMCRNAGLKEPTFPYEGEFDYCVGVGGFSHWNSTLGSDERDEETYTNLLGVYHDLLYEARTNIDNVTYVGLGNGVLDEDDVLVLGALTDGAEKQRIINGINNYLALSEASRTVSRKEDLFELAKSLRTRLSNNNYVAAGNHGGSGGYSRFVLYDTHPMDCDDGFGNCVADGGLGGGYAANNVVSVPNVAEGVENNTMLVNIETAVESETSDDGVLMPVLGGAGGYVVEEEVVPGGIAVVLEDVEVVVPGGTVTVRNSTATEAECNNFLNKYNYYKRKANKAMGSERAGYNGSALQMQKRFNNACCSCTKQEKLPDTVRIEQREVEVQLPDTVVKRVGDSFVGNGGAIVISW